ncbi:hypothetical protein M011DRAFT_485843 [Sporormia fimetaria CBS 119925]|uniref:Transcription factor domain-containing protein n=1 Tax=Sporormia fimetaria CBS 119925 TaxID=1340428 RepID=A0A6A6VEH0_9PLEO|nr:hypothetical protein M011DRAFT_485843 [Sporormia fimetaria CBS 119925]
MHEPNSDEEAFWDAESTISLLTDMALARLDDFTAGVIVPFDCMAVHMNAKTSSMLLHYLHQASHIITTQWVTDALQNATSAPFAYALLASSALHLLALGGSSLEGVLYYKGRAIAGVNELLSSPRTMVDDYAITAVFIFLTLEEHQLVPGNGSPYDAQWNARQRAVHLDGLRAMIEQRGGLAALSANRCLQTFILMHSIAHSISTLYRPYTALLDTIGRPQRYSLPSFRLNPAPNNTFRLFRALHINTDLLDIISDTIMYTNDLSTFFTDRSTPVEPLEPQKQGVQLQYLLFDWYTSTSHVKAKSGIDHSIALATIIFLVRITQPFDPGYRTVILTPIRKLQTALS